MRSGCIIAVAVFSACGLQSGGMGRRLPDGGYLGTSEGCNHKVEDGNRVLEVAQAPFSNITALSFDSERTLYVLNATATSSWISVFGAGPENTYQRTLGKGVIKYGIDLARDTDGTWWVLDWDDAASEAQVAHLSAEGTELTRFSITGDPGGLALAKDGTLVASTGRLKRLKRDGTVEMTFGAKDPYIPNYQGLAFDSVGMLWATEQNERTVERFDSSGARVGTFGGHGAGGGMFDANTETHGGPSKIAIDKNGDLYVNDPLGSRIMKLNRQGTMLGELKFGGATNIDPIAIDPGNGNVFVGRDTGVDIVCPL